MRKKREYRDCKRMLAKLKRVSGGVPHAAGVAEVPACVPQDVRACLPASHQCMHTELMPLCLTAALAVLPPAPPRP